VISARCLCGGAGAVGTTTAVLYYYRSAVQRAPRAVSDSTTRFTVVRVHDVFDLRGLSIRFYITDESKVSEGLGRNIFLGPINLKNLTIYHNKERKV